MADYFCWPLWDVGPTGPDNVDPSTLPLTPQLVEDLITWGKRYDAILNQDYPPDSAFASEADERDFVSTGHQLAVRAAEELRGRYAIYYHNDLDASVTEIKP